MWDLAPEYYKDENGFLLSDVPLSTLGMTEDTTSRFKGGSPVIVHAKSTTGSTIRGIERVCFNFINV